MAAGVRFAGPAGALLCCLAGTALPRLAAGSLPPGSLDVHSELAPKTPVHVRIGIGEAKFLRFHCMGGPADAVITLSSYSESADPMLLLSMDPSTQPSFHRYDASSFGQWQEDAVGNHYVIVKSLGAQGGVLGLFNMRHFSAQELEAVLSIQCNFVIAFDLLFWDHLRVSTVCPTGLHYKAGHLVPGSEFCSGHGRCGKNSLCECRDGYTGSACEHSNQEVVAAEGHYHFKVETGRYQYFRIRIPPEFPGGYLEVRLAAMQPMVVVLSSDKLPTKSKFDLSNFDDWVNQGRTSVLRYQVAASPPSVGAGGGKRFVFVGVYNHRKFKNDRSVVQAQANISLTKDPNFDPFQSTQSSPYGIATSWIGDLYNPFHDVLNLSLEDRQVYPSGNQFVYTLRLTNLETLSMEVRLYRDRVTLLHVVNAAGASNMVLDFAKGHGITHVLASTSRAPKSFFDFDQVHTQVHGWVRISAGGHESVWCMIFGGQDGFVQAQGRAFGALPSNSVYWVFPVICAVAFLCGLLTIATVFGSALKLGDWLGVDDTSGPLSERIPTLCSEKNIEDQYLHRGGIGDDGM